MIYLCFSSCFIKNLPQLCCLAASSVAAFCLDYWLCVECYEYGSLYLLLKHVFDYDFTLEEAGVEISEDTNLQVPQSLLLLFLTLATVFVYYGLCRF